MNQAALSAIRHLLTAVGAIAAARGWVTESVAAEIVGAAVALIGTVWGPLDEWIAARKATSAADTQDREHAAALFDELETRLAPQFAQAEHPQAIEAVEPHFVFRLQRILRQLRSP